jgi:hypothetical protein
LAASDLPPKAIETDAAAARVSAAEQETRLARLEALVLREQLATQQLEKLRADQQALFAEACRAAGIEANPQACVIDLNAHTVTRRNAANEHPTSRPAPVETGAKEKR